MDLKLWNHFFVHISVLMPKYNFTLQSNYLIPMIMYNQIITSFLKWPTVEYVPQMQHKIQENKS